jgi:hypothetical protein
MACLNVHFESIRLRFYKCPSDASILTPGDFRVNVYTTFIK